jgi:uncharacterized protein YbaR (Trm112 family)
LSAVDPELLAKLRCPVTFQDLRLAEPVLLAEINRKIAAGLLKNRRGQLLTQPVEAGLVSADGRTVYPIRDHIPQMLSEEAVLLANE